MNWLTNALSIERVQKYLLEYTTIVCKIYCSGGGVYSCIKGSANRAAGDQLLQDECRHWTPRIFGRLFHGRMPRIPFIAGGRRILQRTSAKS